ncbi:MAG: T9SS type A sorting domain-containing protein [Flavobacteriales bacterium]|nr:T9SS type A sorting domain-containing protein [Flavobacteriales bacterium]
MKHLLTIGLLLHSIFILHAQYGDFGISEQPDDMEAVDDLIFYGSLNDMSGGYHVGDTVFNFTVYDFDGNSINLYEELAGEKPVVIINGSVSCLRFRNAFNSVESHQSYFVVSEFIENTQDMFNYIFVYGIEAHPTDGNCPSNCPPTTSTDTTVVQSPDYAYRRWSLDSWNSAPEFNFPYNLYADNPDNAVYNNFFQRPFGFLGIQCDGTVAFRGDWVFNFILEENNQEQLLEWQDSFETCSIDWPGEGVGNDDDEGNDDDDLFDMPAHAFEGMESGGANATTTYSNEDTRVYPNPANSYLTASSSGPIESVEWFNLSGQRLDLPASNTSTDTWHFELVGLDPGLYLVKIDGAIHRVAVSR